MKIKGVLFITTVLFTTFIFAQKNEVYATKDGAIKGYDPVAYFKEKQAVEGTGEFSFNWKGADWYFSTQENLDTFKENPDAYAPQFGGYCAYAVSQGYTYRVDPKAWKIVDGKLYLNYSRGIQKKWEASQAEFIKSAEVNWPKVLKN